VLATFWHLFAAGVQETCHLPYLYSAECFSIVYICRTCRDRGHIVLPQMPSMIPACRLQVIAKYLVRLVVHGQSFVCSKVHSIHPAPRGRGLFPLTSLHKPESSNACLSLLHTQRTLIQGCPPVALLGRPPMVVQNKANPMCTVAILLQHMNGGLSTN
jgi:hypothetical protein